MVERVFGFEKCENLFLVIQDGVKLFHDAVFFFVIRNVQIDGVAFAHVPTSQPR